MSEGTPEIARLRLVTVRGPLPDELLSDLAAEDDRGIVVIAELLQGGSTCVGAAIGSVERKAGAREATWSFGGQLSDELAASPLPRANATHPDPVHDLVADAAQRALGKLSDEAPVVSVDGIVFAFGQAITRAAERMAAPPSGDAAQLLARLVGDANRYHVAPRPPPITFEGRPSNVYPELHFLRPLGVNGTKGHLLERQALAQGFSTMRLTKGAFVAHRDGGEKLNFKWSRSPISSSVSIALCNHKEATRIQLRRRGIPAPRGRMFVRGDHETAVAYAERIGYPVVSKPAAGVRGIGVVAGIRNAAELEQALEAYASSRLGGDDFIVEEHIDGGDYRIVVIDDQVVAAILREPASVIGDGTHSVAELVMLKNELRRRNPHLWGRLITIDGRTERRLRRQGLGLAAVPGIGTRVRLSDTCSLSQGGDSIDVMDEMHPSIKDAAVAATRAIPGLRYCGVDFLLEDHRKPIEEQASAGICELNAHAAIGNGEYPMFGQPREVARELFARSAQKFGYELGDPADALNVRIDVRGKVTRVNYRQWLARHATAFGVTGWVRNGGSRKVEALLQGPTLPVSALASLAVLGSKRAVPTSTRVDHVDEPHHDGFEVLP